jgi:hypothetical protein
MFSGLMSRWMTPSVCAWASARDRHADRDDLLERHRPFVEARRERLAAQQLHDEVGTLRRQHLRGESLQQRLMLDQVHDRHPTHSDLLVPPKLRTTSRGTRHRCSDRFP